MGNKSVFHSVINNRLFELYAEGNSYSTIKEAISDEFQVDFTNKELGEKMGEIKKQMGCATQFQMGYEYAKTKFSVILEQTETKCQKQLIKEKEQSYFKGHYECKVSLEHRHKQIVNRYIAIFIIIYLVLNITYYAIFN